MSAEELVRILDTWSDALNVAEVVGSPWLRVGDGWDMHDWRSVELTEGVTFQRLGQTGNVADEIVVRDDGTAAREVHGPLPGQDARRTWLLRLVDRSRRGPGHL